MNTVHTRNSFASIDLHIIKEAKLNNNPNYLNLIRAKTKEHKDNPDFLVGLIEIAGTQTFFWQLPDCILNSPEHIKMAVLIDSKTLQFIPENKLSEDILLQVIEGNKLENLFIIPHVTSKLTFSVCYLALKKKTELCLMTFFKAEPNISLSKEEKQVLYSKLAMSFNNLGIKPPGYLEKYDSIISKLTPESLDKIVDIFKIKNKLNLHLPEQNITKHKLQAI